MEIIVGTYEEFLVGYQLKCVDGTYTLEQSFTDRAHCGSVRCLASCPKLMASGSTDEVIRIFNMFRRNDCGTLIQHSGTITHLEFFKSSHLFSASEDGSICVWDTRNWVCDKTLKGHKGPINSISVHPSGKLMLSVAKDKSLRTWNLIKGRCAYVTNIKATAHIVQWSPSCTFFAVVVDKKIDIYDITIGGVVHSIDFGKRVNCISFLSNDVIVIGGDSNDIQIYDIKNKSNVRTFTAHNNRLKAIKTISSYPDIKDNKIWIVSVSSDQFVKVWELDLLQLKNEPKLIASIDTTCRPTCLTVRISDTTTTSDDNMVQLMETNVLDENSNTSVSKKRKNKSSEKFPNKKV